MSNHYHDILFTDDVKAIQSRAGSREIYARQENSGNGFHAELGPDEYGFIAAQDSFYMASISTSGWPYVQHRGGPKGFLKPLGENTLAFADYTGNRQYISTGNFTADNRVSIILTDYTLRRRIKLLAHAEVITRPGPELVAALTNPHYTAHFKAGVERVIKLNVEAFEWNCPKYITERYSVTDVHQATQALRERLARMQALLIENGIEFEE